MSRPGDNESFIDSRAAPSDPAALSEPIVWKSPVSTRESDSAGQGVESPTHAELPVVGAGSYTKNNDPTECLYSVVTCHF